MAYPFIGEIRIFAGSFAPVGWLFCQGQELPVNQYQALYAVMGNTYGGNPPNTFKLPDLRGNAPMGFGSGTGLTPRNLGATGGTATVALNSNQMPNHKHTVQCTTNDATASSPVNGLWATSRGTALYSSNVPNTQMSAQALGASGGSSGSTSAHNNMQPFLGINFIISYEGDFPVRP